ncbi:hypothetical protein ACP4OV_013441 [Aristida adscensionis]
MQPKRCTSRPSKNHPFVALNHVEPTEIAQGTAKRRSVIGGGGGDVVPSWSGRRMNLRGLTDGGASAKYADKFRRNLLLGGICLCSEKQDLGLLCSVLKSCPQIQKLVDFIFLDNAIGQCEVATAGIFYEMLSWTDLWCK